MTIAPDHSVNEEMDSFEKIIDLARQKIASDRKPKAALVIPDEEAMLRAFVQAVENDLIDPFIIGSEKEFGRIAAESNISLNEATIVEVSSPEQSVATAVQMAARSEIDLIVKGRIATSDFLKLVLRREASFVPKLKILCHIAVIKPARYEKLLLLTDAAVVVQPNLKQKLALIQNATGFARQIGIVSPRVAVLAAVEMIYPQMPVTTEAAVLAKMSDRGQIKGALVDGPVSFDCAVDKLAAESKGLKNSQVVGQADVLLAPNIETAGGIYRAMALYGRAQMGGVLVGGKVPVALGARSDSVETKFHSIVLGTLAG